MRTAWTSSASREDYGEGLEYNTAGDSMPCLLDTHQLGIEPSEESSTKAPERQDIAIDTVKVGIAF